MRLIISYTKVSQNFQRNSGKSAPYETNKPSWAANQLIDVHIVKFVKIKECQEYDYVNKCEKPL